MANEEPGHRQATYEGRQAARLAYLRAAYDASDADPMGMFDWEKVAEAAGVERGLAEAAVSYLATKGLLEWRTSQWLSLTTWGIDEAEQLLADPETRSENLPAPASINVMNVKEMYGSFQIQQGVTNSPQTVGDATVDRDRLHALVSDLRAWLEDADLNEDDRLEAKAELMTLESQLGSSRPKNTIVKESLATFRRIIEGVSAGVATSTLVAHLNDLGS